MVAISATTLIVAFIFGLQCRPLSVAWGVGKGTCMSTAVTGNAAIVLSAVDVAVSWLYGVRTDGHPFPLALANNDCPSSYLFGCCIKHECRLSLRLQCYFCSGLVQCELRCLSMSSESRMTEIPEVQ